MFMNKEWSELNKEVKILLNKKHHLKMELINLLHLEVYFLMNGKKL